MLHFFPLLFNLLCLQLIYLLKFERNFNVKNDAFCTNDNKTHCLTLMHYFRYHLRSLVILRDIIWCDLSTVSV